MKSSVSALRWIFLLYLSVLIIATIQVDSFAQVSVSCCRTVSSKWRFKHIEECREQKERYNCRLHAFLIKPTKNRDWLCIKPSAALNNMLQKRNISCPPAVELNHNNHTG